MNFHSDIVIHPIVLLSIVDHFKRVVQSNTKKRVVGVLLGEQNSKDKIDVTNCYGIPFDEDIKEKNVWFVDHLYHEQMLQMLRRINSKEKVIGWYTTGTSFRNNDININEVFKKYTENPILVVIDVNHEDELALPTEAYVGIEEINKDGETVKKFKHLPSTVQAYEAEEVGIEHLLRDIKDISLNTISNSISSKIKSLRGLLNKMQMIQQYLKKTIEKSNVNQKVIYNLQEIFNLLPNLSDENLIKSLFMKNNDMQFTLYISSIIRATIALHDLLNNKQLIKEHEQNKDKPKEEKNEDESKDKDKKIDKNKEDDKTKTKETNENEKK